MALLTRINNRPLYSTIQEAVAWGASRGLTGTHTHQYQGQTGYMGGATHDQALNVNENNINTNTTPSPSPNIPSPSGSGGGGGGGGGGY